MNKIYIILPILISHLTISSHSNGEWTYFTKNDSGGEFYIDYDRIKKRDNIVYVWVLSDLLEPNKWNSLSYIYYYKYNCEIPLKYMTSQIMFCNDSMGKGNCETSRLDDKWLYPRPGSVNEALIEKVCSQ